MATFDIKLEISQDIAGYLLEESRNRGISLDQVVSDILADYFAELTEDQILESIRIGMRQALAGQGRPAREALAEVEQEVTGDRRLKRLRRKYPAVTVEVSKLVTELENDKRPGVKLAGFGFDLYKVRLPNPSAQRGKSGGFRVVYYVQFVDLIHLVTIYSKSEESDIGIQAVQGIIADIEDIE